MKTTQGATEEKQIRREMEKLLISKREELGKLIGQWFIHKKTVHSLVGSRFCTVVPNSIPPSTGEIAGAGATYLMNAFLNTETKELQRYILVLKTDLMKSSTSLMDLLLRRSASTTEGEVTSLMKDVQEWMNGEIYGAEESLFLMRMKQYLEEGKIEKCNKGLDEGLDNYAPETEEESLEALGRANYREFKCQSTRGGAKPVLDYAPRPVEKRRDLGIRGVGTNSSLKSIGLLTWLGDKNMSFTKIACVGAGTGGCLLPFLEQDPELEVFVNSLPDEFEVPHDAIAMATPSQLLKHQRRVKGQKLLEDGVGDITLLSTRLNLSQEIQKWRGNEKLFLLCEIEPVTVEQIKTITESLLNLVKLITPELCVWKVNLPHQATMDWLVAQFRTCYKEVSLLKTEFMAPGGDEVYVIGKAYTEGKEVGMSHTEANSAYSWIKETSQTIGRALHEHYALRLKNVLSNKMKRQMLEQLKSTFLKLGVFLREPINIPQLSREIETKMATQVPIKWMESREVSISSKRAGKRFGQPQIARMITGAIFLAWAKFGIERALHLFESIEKSQVTVRQLKEADVILPLSLPKEPVIRWETDIILGLRSRDAKHIARQWSYRVLQIEYITGGTHQVPRLLSEDEEEDT
jgi:hypothetical protein